MMIAKLEWTQRNTQRNIEQLQNPTMNASIMMSLVKLEIVFVKQHAPNHMLDHMGDTHLTLKAPPIICSRQQFQILQLFQK